MPDEPVRALALMSTLMPHLSAGRQHSYRNAVMLGLLAALIAAAFGVLSIALVLAAVALPAVVLTYIHDHNVWRDQPFTLVGLGFLLSLALGVGAGLVQQYFAERALLTAPSRQLPSVALIVELGVLVPLVAFLAVLVAPMLVTAGRAFCHPIDALVTSSLSGAALSLGMSIAIQHDAFTRIEATATDPAHTAFIALTLGFLQPIIFATAAAVTVVRVRSAGGAPLIGAVQGLSLVLVYELATTLLAPYGARGIVCTTVVALVLAAAGVVASRDALHRGLLLEAQAALDGPGSLVHPADSGQVCAHCGAAMVSGAAFCQACGSASAALARYGALISTSATSDRPPNPTHTSE
ncbi:hypothetical protein Mkiyose1665_49520 [Mycobacterium kiyosense]|uniref:Zinc ribbon domain-containing protein n=2 Tax=Mycobacteriaceae TaxID=1762 RepID=A0A9P3Q4M7_9MYCO|nr:hypothetical protein IWGMT90018_12300 [Mycobacterium kiyosense]BDE12587.1 hypothetical protein MKCMC460_14470 [Mycobacterium sp. 20KCMC460]GLB84911.1 hypothetical protein SRL2020028_41670 [Mycobacterium kiyosense]GLB87966.1 hypothetical protein SRL2020130_07830 [Mycobacterium kiyosense]GLB98062.1 hypothetical protein SRL2020226_48380 [Mycobacterium kiyosense]